MTRNDLMAANKMKRLVCFDCVFGHSWVRTTWMRPSKKKALERKQWGDDYALLKTAESAVSNLLWQVRIIKKNMWAGVYKNNLEETSWMRTFADCPGEIKESSKIKLVIKATGEEKWV